MPIVTEHPRSIDVIRRLADDCDHGLEAFVSDFTARRRAYDAAAQSGHRAQEAPKATACEGMSWQELCAVLTAREAAAETLRDDLQLMTRELTLLKREMRRARRQMRDAGFPVEELPGDAMPSAPPGATQTASIQQYVDRVRTGQNLAWVKPWLRGFIPGAA